MFFSAFLIFVVIADGVIMLVQTNIGSSVQQVLCVGLTAILAMLAVIAQGIFSIQNTLKAQAPQPAKLPLDPHPA